MIIIDVQPGGIKPPREGSSFCICNPDEVVVPANSRAVIDAKLSIKVLPGHIAAITGFNTPDGLWVKSFMVVDAFPLAVHVIVANLTGEDVKILGGEGIAHLVVLPCYGGPDVRPEVTTSR
jgi:dUTPase